MNNIIFVLVSCFSLVSNDVAAQHGSSNFILDGTINVDTGVVKLIPIMSASYYSTDLPFKEAKITGGKFVFNGLIDYPVGFQLLLTSSGDYISDIFFIDSGKQKIVCNADSRREIPIIENAIMKEYLTEFMPEFIAVKNKYENYKESIIERRKYLFRYIKKHYNSYVSLWLLVDELKRDYAPSLDTSFMYLSESVKNSYTGYILGNQLSTSKLTSIGRKFPDFKILNLSGDSIMRLENKYHSKYTFVDFWFSHCPPCLQQFGEYRNIYKSVTRSELEIVGISVDFKKNISAWKRVIHDSTLNWIQYLDLDGLMAIKYGITLFPTNFLLDANNIIIAKNLGPGELEEIVRKKN